MTTNPEIYFFRLERRDVQERLYSQIGEIHPKLICGTVNLDHDQTQQLSPRRSI